MKIHGLQMHAYTDNILEYCLEVTPVQLVHLASAGIQRLRKPTVTFFLLNHHHLPTERSVV